MKAFLNQCQHWIFDLDGTLTQAVHDFDRMRDILGIPRGEDILGHIAGLPEHERIEKNLQLDQLELDYAIQAKPAQGVYELIELLVERKSQLGIVTRNTKAFAHLSLQALRLDEYFPIDHIVGRDEAEPKPDPSGIAHLMRLWSCAPEQTVMVGDYKYDLLAGRAAGCKTIHVSMSSQQWPQVTDLYLGSLSDLADMSR